MTKLNETGFGAVGVLVVVVVVAAVGFVGWKVYDNSKSPATTPAVSQQNQDDVPTVSGASDLKEAEDYLNSQDIDKKLDTSEIDQSLSE